MHAIASKLPLGAPILRFELPATDGQTYFSQTDPPPAATVVVFMCNHCPYVIAWNDRIHAVANDYANKSVRFIAINSNDARQYPADSFDEMQRFVRENNWPMPYLHDVHQTVAESFGAEVTPHIFVFDRQLQLAYHGAPDSDHEDPSQNAAWIRSALDAILGGDQPEIPETSARGCSIKWLQQNHANS